MEAEFLTKKNELSEELYSFMKDKRDVELEKFKLDRKHETDNAIGEVDKEYLALSEKYKSEHLENDYNTKGQ